MSVAVVSVGPTSLYIAYQKLGMAVVCLLFIAAAVWSSRPARRWWRRGRYPRRAPRVLRLLCSLPVTSCLIVTGSARLPIGLFGLSVCVRGWC